MTEPIIEHKHRQPAPRRDTTISLLEARRVQGEREAQKILNQLEQAMVRCGYTSDGIYNSRQAGWTSRRERATVILWRNGKILLGRGLKTDQSGKAKRPYEANEAVSARQMSARDLICVASHLAPFLDALEANVRHQVEALAKATETLQAMLDRVEADPRPSDAPVQMSLEEAVPGDDPGRADE